MFLGRVLLGEREGGSGAFLFSCFFLWERKGGGERRGFFSGYYPKPPTLPSQTGVGGSIRILESGEKILYMPAKPARGVKCEPRFHLGVFVGMLNSSSEAVVVTQQGSAIRTRAANVMRIFDSESWDVDRTLGMRAVPWSRDDSGTAFDRQVGMARPAEMVLRSPREVLIQNKVART